MSDKQAAKMVIFDGDNFDEFETALLFHLRSKNCSKPLSQAKPLPLVAGENVTPAMISKREDAISKWEEMDESALGKIGERVQEKFYIKIRDCKTSGECFEILKKISESNAANSMIKARASFSNAKYPNSDDIQEYFSTLETIQRKLAGTDAKIGSTELIMKVLATLPDHWKPFCDSLRAQPEMMTDYAKFSEAMLSESLLKKQLNKGKEGKEVTSAMNAATEKFKGKCNNCHKKGHKAANCWAKGGGAEGKGPKQNNEKGQAKQAQATTSHFVLMAAQSGHEEDDQVTCIVDSGASDHMFSNKGIFKCYSTYDRPIQINVAGNTSVPAVGEGEVTIEVVGTGIVVTLTKVLHVPALKSKNLLSVRRLAEKEVEILVKKNSLVAKKGNNNLFEAKNIGGLYTISAKPILNQEQAHMVQRTNKKSIEDWHRILGHMNYEYIKKLPSVVNGMELKNASTVEGKASCTICLQSKGTKYSFAEQAQREKAIVGEDCHSDLGFIDGAPYATFTDGASGCTYTEILDAKDDVAEALKRYCTMSRTQYGHTIKRVHCDGGGEYKGRFKAYCDENGIAIIPTSPYTPQQNAKAERKNRTLKETAAGMLLDAHLDPGKYGKEAILHATFIRNRQPVQGTDKTHVEIFTGKKPDFRFMERFGATCVLVQDKKQKKGPTLSPRGIPCILLGMRANGYYVESVDNKKRHVSCHVKFVKESESDRIKEVLAVSDSDDDSDDENAVANKVIARDIEHESPRINERAQPQQNQGANSPPRAQVEIPVPNAPRPNRIAARWVVEEVGDENAIAPQDINANVEAANIIGDVNTRTTRRHAYTAFTKQSDIQEPKTYMEAMSGENASFWERAFKEEERNLMEKGTLSSPMDIPEGIKPIKCKPVFKVKYNADGSVDKFKVRIVAQGFTQIEGVDYDSVFAPVVSITAVRICFSLAAKFRLSLYSVDVSGAYLYADLDKELYMDIPKGFTGYKPGKCVRLLKGLYGLKQSGKLWHQELVRVLVNFGLQQNPFEPGLFYMVSADGQLILHVCVYVDDLLIGSNDDSYVRKFVDHLEQPFKLSSSGQVNQLLNIRVLQYKDSIALDQERYIQTKMIEFRQENARSKPIPIAEGFQPSGVSLPNEVPYLALIGSLGYAAKTCRPDIAFAFGYLSRFSHSCDVSTWNAAKGTLRYLNATKNLKIVYQHESSLELHAYVDASIKIREPANATTGFVIYLGSHLIHWKSKKQKIPSCSSAEAEIYALHDVIRNLLWLKGLLTGMGLHIPTPLIVREDNQATVRLSEEFILNERTKHLSATLHFIRYYVQESIIKIEYVSSDDNVADLMTKPLGRHQFERLRDHLCLETGGVLEGFADNEITSDL